MLVQEGVLTHISTGQDALELLMKDHADVQALFEEYEYLKEMDVDDDGRQQAAEKIYRMLTVHAKIEEELVYPALRNSLDDGFLIDDAEIEHAVLEELIDQLKGMDADEKLYDSKVKVLGEYVSQHVKEEEGDIFPQVRESGLDLVELGEQVRARKEQLT
ncbi:MAG: hemerythrin domain-containing protein [Pseudomonadota bacterium]